MLRRRLMTLALVAVMSCSGDDDGVPDGRTDGTSDAADWGGACDDAVCARLRGPGQTCSCEADRCVCTCDPATCSATSCWTEGYAPFCQPDETCICECWYGPYCGADADADADADAGPVVCRAGGDECGPDEMCDLHPTSCDDTSARGTCIPRPESCVPDWEPLCGCDGVSYLGQCERVRAGAVSSATDYCPTDPPCGGATGLECPTGQLCSVVGCSEPPLMKVCVPVPETCPDVSAPVCACDRATYANDCLRLKAGVARDQFNVAIRGCP